MIELDSKVKALEAANARVESLREEGERAVLLQELLSNSQSENNALMSENDDLQDEIAQLRAELSKANAHLESNAEDSSHGFQSSFGGPEEQLKVLHEEYQSELVKTAEEGKRVQAELAKAYEARIRELNEHHAEELARLAESNPVNQADYDQFAPFDDSSVNATNEQNEALSNQLKEAEQKLLRAESENKHLLSNYAQLEARLEAMGNDISNNIGMSEAYEGAQRDIAAMKEMIVRLENELKQAQQNNVSDDNQALLKAESRSRALELELSQLKAQLDSSGSNAPFDDRVALESKIAELEHSQRIAESTRRDIVRKAKALKERASSTIENLKKELDDAQVKIAQLESRAGKAGSSDGSLSDGDDDFDWNW